MLSSGASASGSGYTWDGATCTLTLDGFNRTYGAKAEGGIGIMAEGEDVTLVLQGENVMTDLPTNTGGIVCEGNSLTLKGNGFLSCKGSAGALGVSGGSIRLAQGYSLNEGADIFNDPSGSEDEIAIDETNFPDAEFRAYVNNNFDTDKNGFLSPAERNTVTEINVYLHWTLGSLEGIAYFPNLTSLNCSQTSLTALDVSSNTALEELDCSYSDLTALDVSHNLALKNLDCANNYQLTALDVSQNPALGYLDCSYNDLTELDVSRNTELEELYCSGNQLTQLDLSSNTWLDEDWVDCSGQSLAKTGTASGDGWTLDLSNLVDNWSRVSNVTAKGGASLAEDGKTVTWPAGAEAPAVTYDYDTQYDTQSGNYTMDVTIHLEKDPSIAGATVQLSETEFTYNGNEHKPTVTVTGKGNYGGKATASYTIDPAALTITGVALADKTYDGTKTATVESVTFKEFALKEFALVKDRDYTAAAVYDSADAGTDRTATVTVTLKSGNYTLENSTYTLENQTIKKAEFGGTTEVTGTVLAGYPGSVNLPAIPGDASYGTPNASAGLTGLSIADGVLSYTGGESITVGQEYTITVPVSGSVNYEDYDVTVTLTGTDKQTLTITGVTAQDGTYNGQAQTGYTGTPSAQGYTGDFTVTYNTEDGTAPINAGKYTVTIAIPDSNSQYMGSITLEFTVAKAAVTVTAPSLTIQVGEAIPDLSALSCSITGLVGSDAMGNVALAYEGTPDSSQTGSYAIVPSGGAFTSGSADNYNVQYVNGSLTIREKEPEIYTVSFDANGGSGRMADQAFTFGVPQALAANTFTRSGYTFAGWNTKADGSGTAYGDRDTLTIGAADLTLYAQWTKKSSGSDSDHDNETETDKNPDGSTTTTVTKPDGSTTETTKYPDGSKEVVETDKNGTVTTTTDKNGNQTAVVENPDGSAQTTVDNKDGSSSITTVDENGKTEAEVKLPAAVVEDAQEKGEAVALPMPSVSASSDWDEAPTVTVDLPSGSSAKVEIPVERVTPGTVAVIVKADGTQEVIKTSLTTDNGVAVTLSDGDTVKLVDNSKTFVDVPASYWGSEYIDFASSRELFTGTGSATFSPDASITRGMIVTVLASLDGADTSSAGGAWYEAGRQWAVANGISDGTNMEGSLTREQLAVMLWSYAGKPAADSLSGYADAASVSDWAAQAMAWCVKSGVISGMDGGLNPQGTATRAQVATMLMRFVETMA